MYKTLNNEVLFLQSTEANTAIFNKAIVVALEPDVNLTIEEGEVEQAEISFDSKSKRSLVIHCNKNNLLYLFGLDEKASLDKFALLQQNNTTEHSKIVKVLGFGISVLNGNWNKEKFVNYPSSSAFDKLSNSSNLVAPPGPGDKKCTSGGEGAKECSITEIMGMSCSVSCNDGYYACCNSSTTTCFCLKKPPPKPRQ